MAFPLIGITLADCNGTVFFGCSAQLQSDAIKIKNETIFILV